MKDDTLLKIFLFDQPSRAKRKAGRLQLGWENVVKKDLREMGTLLEGVRREVSNRLGRRRSVRSCIGLKWLSEFFSNGPQNLTITIYLSSYRLLFYCLNQPILLVTDIHILNLVSNVMSLHKN